MNGARFWHSLPVATATSLAPASAGASAPAEFTGGLIMAAGDYLYWLGRDPDTGQFMTTRLPGSNSNWFFRDPPPMAPAPDGQALLYAIDDPGRTVILNLKTGGQTFVADDDAHCLSWSPDGKRITFAATVEGTYGLYVYTLASRAVDLEYAPPSVGMSAVAPPLQASMLDPCQAKYLLPCSEGRGCMIGLTKLASTRRPPATGRTK